MFFVGSHNQTAGIIIRENQRIRRTGIRQSLDLIPIKLLDPLGIAPHIPCFYIKHLQLTRVSHFGNIQFLNELGNTLDFTRIAGYDDFIILIIREDPCCNRSTGSLAENNRIQHSRQLGWTNRFDYKCLNCRFRGFALFLKGLNDFIHHLFLGLAYSHDQFSAVVITENIGIRHADSPFVLHLILIKSPDVVGKKGHIGMLYLIRTENPLHTVRHTVKLFDQLFCIFDIFSQTKNVNTTRLCFRRDPRSVTGTLSAATAYNIS